MKQKLSGSQETKLSFNAKGEIGCVLVHKISTVINKDSISGSLVLRRGRIVLGLALWRRLVHRLTRRRLVHGLTRRWSGVHGLARRWSGVHGLLGRNVHGLARGRRLLTINRLRLRRHISRLVLDNLGSLMKKNPSQQEAKLEQW